MEMAIYIINAVIIQYHQLLLDHVIKALIDHSHDQRNERFWADYHCFTCTQLVIRYTYSRYLFCMHTHIDITLHTHTIHTYKHYIPTKRSIHTYSHTCVYAHSYLHIFIGVLHKL